LLVVPGGVGAGGASVARVVLVICDEVLVVRETVPELVGEGPDKQ